MLTHVQYTTPPTPPPYPHTHTNTGAGAALLTDESVSASKEQAALWQLSLQTLLTWNSPSCYHSSLFFLSSLQGTFAGNPSPLSRSLSLSFWLCLSQTHITLTCRGWGLKCQLSRYGNKKWKLKSSKRTRGIQHRMKSNLRWFKGWDQKREAAAAMPVPGLHFYLHTLTESSTITPEPSLKIWLAWTQMIMAFTCNYPKGGITQCMGIMELGNGTIAR